MAHFLFTIYLPNKQRPLVFHGIPCKTVSQSREFLRSSLCARRTIPATGDFSSATLVTFRAHQRVDPVLDC